MALPVGSTIGILGGGQLGRMMSVAAGRLGYHVHIFTPEKDGPAAEVSASATVAAYDDREALARFAATVDLVTLEFENVPIDALDFLSRTVPVHPGLKVLQRTQHRLLEKQFVGSLGIETARFAAVRNETDMAGAANVTGFPAILKTCRMGYDGRGQKRVESMSELRDAWQALGGGETILEGFVTFEHEVSVIVARGEGGEMRAFPPARNIHRDHILHETHVPSGLSADIEEEAIRIARQIAEAAEVGGLLAVEFFVGGDGRLIVNELAPRPHNSGHWTLDSAATDQFEQAIRAVAGLPLGPAHVLSKTKMLNLIGDEIDTAQEILVRHPEARLHLYGKRETLPGRKMGHVNFPLGTVSG